MCPITLIDYCIEFPSLEYRILLYIANIQDTILTSNISDGKYVNITLWNTGTRLGLGLGHRIARGHKRHGQDMGTGIGLGQGTRAQATDADIG